VGAAYRAEGAVEGAADLDLSFFLLGRAENRLVEEHIGERDRPELALVPDDANHACYRVARIKQHPIYDSSDQSASAPKSRKHHAACVGDERES